MAEKKYVIDVPELMKDWDWKENDAHGFSPGKIPVQLRKRVFLKCLICNGTWNTQTDKLTCHPRGAKGTGVLACTV